MLHVLQGLSPLAAGNIKFSQPCVSFSIKIVLLLLLEDSFSDLSFFSPTFTSALQQDLNCLHIAPFSLGSASQILAALDFLNSNLSSQLLSSFLLIVLQPGTSFFMQLTRANMGFPCLLPFFWRSLFTFLIVQCLKTPFIYFYWFTSHIMLGCWWWWFNPIPVVSTEHEPEVPRAKTVYVSVEHAREHVK